MLTRPKLKKKWSRGAIRRSTQTPVWTEGLYFKEKPQVHITPWVLVYDRLSRFQINLIEKALHVSGGGEDWNLKSLYSNRSTFYSILSVMLLLMTGDAIEAMQGTIFLLLPWYLSRLLGTAAASLHLPCQLTNIPLPLCIVQLMAIFSCAECVSKSVTFNKSCSSCIGQNGFKWFWMHC